MDHVTKRVILDLVMASMYVALPVLWTAMVGWAGYNLMTMSKVVAPMSASTEKAGGTGAKMATGAATKGVMR